MHSLGSAEKGIVGKMRRTGHFCTAAKTRCKVVSASMDPGCGKGKAKSVDLQWPACLLEWTALIRPIASVEESYSRISISVVLYIWKGTAADRLYGLQLRD